MVQVQAHARAMASLPLKNVVDSGACRRVANAERGETVGDLFLKARAERWRGAEAQPSNVGSASATPTSAERRVRSGRQRPAHAGAGSSVRADTP